MTTRREFISGVLAGIVAAVLPKMVAAMPEVDEGIAIEGRDSVSLPVTSDLEVWHTYRVLWGDRDEGNEASMLNEFTGEWDVILFDCNEWSYPSDAWDLIESDITRRSNE